MGWGRGSGADAHARSWRRRAAAAALAAALPAPVLAVVTATPAAAHHHTVCDKVPTVGQNVLASIKLVNGQSAIASLAGSGSVFGGHVAGLLGATDTDLGLPDGVASYPTFGDLQTELTGRLDTVLGQLSASFDEVTQVVTQFMSGFITEALMIFLQPIYDAIDAVAGGLVTAMSAVGGASVEITLPGFPTPQEGFQGFTKESATKSTPTSSTTTTTEPEPDPDPAPPPTQFEGGSYLTPNAGDAVRFILPADVVENVAQLLRPDPAALLQLLPGGPGSLLTPVTSLLGLVPGLAPTLPALDPRYRDFVDQLLDEMATFLSDIKDSIPDLDASLAPLGIGAEVSITDLVKSLMVPAITFLHLIKSEIGKANALHEACTSVTNDEIGERTDIEGVLTGSGAAEMQYMLPGTLGGLLTTDGTTSPEASSVETVVDRTVSVMKDLGYNVTNAAAYQTKAKEELKKCPQAPPLPKPPCNYKLAFKYFRMAYQYAVALP